MSEQSGAGAATQLPVPFASRYVMRHNKLGEGTYGVVYRAHDTLRNCYVAVKKVRMEVAIEGVPTTALREISVLKEVRHPNIVPLDDVFVSPSNHLYLVFELLDCDLKLTLDTVKYDHNAPDNMGFPHTGLHPYVVKWFVYQLLAGTQACHEARIVHRDIKPQNILLNAQGDLKIADFGLARTYGIPLRPYTHEVVTLWYRAPEILLGEATYSPAVDVWSIGCILSEMATGKALFDGDSEIDQIHRIFEVLGHPTSEQWPAIADRSRLPDYRSSLPRFRRKDPNVWAACLEPVARDLLMRMLEFDPTRRISCAEALKHEWFKDVKLPEREAEARRLVGEKLAWDKNVYAGWAADEKARLALEREAAEAARREYSAGTSVPGRTAY